LPNPSYLYILNAAGEGDREGRDGGGFTTQERVLLLEVLLEVLYKNVNAL